MPFRACFYVSLPIVARVRYANPFSRKPLGAARSILDTLKSKGGSLGAPSVLAADGRRRNFLFCFFRVVRGVLRAFDGIIQIVFLSLTLGFVRSTFFANWL